MIRVAVVFGGANTEHDVSCNSARDVAAALDRDRYDVTLLGIDRVGGWHRLESVDDLAATGSGSGSRLPDLDGIDVAIPILHGRFGEDGTVQGLFELAGIPYTGCGVLASALAMDKFVAASVLAAAGIPTIDSVAITTAQRPLAGGLVAHLGYPLFVKPNRSGSSVGASRVETERDLDAAIEEALRHDDHALIQPVVDGDEVDVGLLQLPGGQVLVGAPLRVHPSAAFDFFDYAAKYTAGGASFEVPAELAPETTVRLVELAQRAFSALGCDGIARIDFFLGRDGALTINEVNTLPGLTARSQFPLMFGAVGRSLSFVVDTLIARALRQRSPRILRLASGLPTTS